MDKNRVDEDILGLYCFHISITIFLLPSFYIYIIVNNSWQEHAVTFFIFIQNYPNLPITLNTSFTSVMLLLFMEVFLGNIITFHTRTFIAWLLYFIFFNPSMNVHQYFLNNFLNSHASIYIFHFSKKKKSAILGKQIRWFYSMLMMKQKAVYD